MSINKYVIIMDVVDSSKSMDRDSLTYRIENALTKINTIQKPQFFAPFEITRGDEIAGVLSAVGSTFEIIDLLMESLLPEFFRTVVVYGKLTAGLDQKRSTMIDGPAFYKGNAKMLALKKSQKYFSIDTGNDLIDRTSESLMNLYLWQWLGFTDLQRKIVRLYQNEKNQARVGKIIGKTQQQVQETLKACRWEILTDTENSLRALFHHLENIPPGTE